MKSVWIDEWLIPRAWRSSGESSRGALDRLDDRGAEGDVRRGVLVEERVVEDEPRLPDARVAVDERDLAEPRRAVVGRRRAPASAPRRRRREPRRRGRPRSEPRARGRPCPGSAAGRSSARSPSTRRASGVVNTSSVGMFATCLIPFDSSSAACQIESGWSPTVRSVPGPRYRSASNRRSFSACARAGRASAMCSRHAATGSGSSSRTAVATARQSRSTSGSPKTVVAQPSFGNATIDQLQRPPVSLEARLGERRASARGRRGAPSRSAKISGSGLPLIESSAPPSRPSCSIRSTSHGGDQPRASSAACSMWARRTCWSL